MFPTAAPCLLRDTEPFGDFTSHRRKGVLHKQPWGGSVLSRAVRILRKRLKPIEKVLPREFKTKIFQPNKITDLIKSNVYNQEICFPRLWCLCKAGKVFQMNFSG